MTKKYNLEVTKEQVDIINNALDLYSRIFMGQLQEVEHVLRWHCNDKDFDKFKKVREGLDLAKAALGHPPNGSYGIHNKEVHDVARKAYDIQHVISNCVAWNEMDKDPNNDKRDWSKQLSWKFDKPSKSSVDGNFELPIMTSSFEAPHK